MFDNSKNNGEKTEGCGIKAKDRQTTGAGQIE
jgi:hypothetical protein